MIAKYYLDLKIESEEFDLPHCQYSKWCSRPRHEETPFCKPCWGHEDSKSAFHRAYASKIKIKFTDRAHFIAMKDKYTDLTVQIDEQKYQVHRVVLAASSDYFDKMFSWKEEQIHELKDVTPETFGKYLDLLYGKEVFFDDWRTLVEFCFYTKMTLLKWRMDRVIWQLYVPREDFVEYVKKLEQLYDNMIPLALISQLNVFYREEMDISMFDQRFQETVIQPNVLGPLRRVTNVYYRNEKYRLYFELGCIYKKECTGYYTEDNDMDIKELTPELIKFCDDNDIDIKQ